MILDLRGSIWESLQHHRRSSEELPACSARRGNELPRPILIFVAAKRNGSAYCSRGGSDVPRPILIFVAAKKNSSVCSSR